MVAPAIAALVCDLVRNAHKRYGTTETIGMITNFYSCYSGADVLQAKQAQRTKLLSHRSGRVQHFQSI